MKPDRFLLVALLAPALWPLAAGAQASAPAGASASAAAPGTLQRAPPVKPPPRLLSPAESRDTATPPGELRPDERVMPQIVLPLGRKPVAEPLPTRRGRAASAGGIHDAAARCQAIADADERARCRDRATREAPGSSR